MSRIHFFEFEDLSWFPSRLRDYMTDFLQFLANKSKIYAPTLPVIERGIEKSKSNTILDLASGGGGSLLWLNEELKKNIPDLKIILTDYYPNIPAFEHTKKQSANFEYIAASVDATAVPKELHGLRTMFLSFHHFKPDDAQKILQNTVDNSSSIAIFEAQERSFLSILAMLFSPITLLLVTPFIRPFRWGRLLFTYLIPVLPLLVLWDGLVSCFRTYSVKELEKLVMSIENKEDYTWEINRIQSGPGVIIYLLACPEE